MTNPQVGNDELAAAQEQPEVIVNALIRAVTRLLAGAVTINFASAADVELTLTQALTATVIMTDTEEELGSSPGHAVIYPDVDTLIEEDGASGTTAQSRARFLFVNQTLVDLTIKRSGQTGVTVPAGSKAFVWHNGTDIELVAEPPT